MIYNNTRIVIEFSTKKLISAFSVLIILVYEPCFHDKQYTKTYDGNVGGNGLLSILCMTHKTFLAIRLWTVNLVLYYRKWLYILYIPKKSHTYWQRSKFYFLDV